MSRQTQTKKEALHILHIDADSFFASCEQALNPALKNKPVITGRERKIATAMSYEAKVAGVTRGMTMTEIRKVCPTALFVESHYEAYQLFSKRMFAIIRRYSEAVEEYGIDEGFVDITGMTKPLGMSYPEIAKAIQRDIHRELGITVSIGLASTKSLAKIGSSYNKPHGFVHMTPKRTKTVLANLSVKKIWGVGRHTALYMRGLGIGSAAEFTQKSLGFVKEYFAKPHQEIWHELNGTPMYTVMPEEKMTFASISKTYTFTPTQDKQRVYAHLIKNLERACHKARKYKLSSKRIVIYLKEQNFTIRALEIEIARSSAFPHDFTTVVNKIFHQLFISGHTYRASGIVLAGLHENTHTQSSLFESPVRLTKLQHIYHAVDMLNKKFHTNIVRLAAGISSPKKHQHVPKQSRSFGLLSLPLLTGAVK